MNKQLTFKLEHPIEELIPAMIEFNNSELLQSAEELAAQYSGTAYTEAMIPQAKEDRARLNALIKAINDERIRISKIYSEPYNLFKKQVDEVVSCLQEPVRIIGDQLNAYEAERKEKKLSELKACYEGAAADIMEFVPFERIFNEKWLNASVSFKNAVAEMDKIIDNIRNALTTIDALKSEDVTTLKAYFFRTLDLAQTLVENERLKETKRKLEEAKARAAEEKVESPVSSPAEPTRTQVLEDKESKEKLYDVTLQFKGLTLAQAQALMAYVKENDLTFVRLK